MFYLKDNFLSKDECEYLIRYWKEYPEEKKIIYNDTKVVRLCKITTGNLWMDDLFKYIGSKCSSLSDSEIVCDNVEIVRWEPENYMRPHKDDEDICSVIVYLNDDYQGGETGVCFNDPKGQQLTIEPKQGRMIAFTNGTKDGYYHWVNKVKDCDRYTLAFWFTAPK